MSRKRDYSSSFSSDSSNSSDSDDSTRSSKKRKLQVDSKLKKIVNESVKGGKLFIEIATPNLGEEGMLELYNSFKDSDHSFKFIPPYLVKLKLSDEEKTQRKRAYRAKYNSLPKTIALREENKKDAEKQRQRKEYSARQEVKNRKAQLQRAKRDFIGLARQGIFQPYDEYMDKHVPKIQREKKPKAPPRKKVSKNPLNIAAQACGTRPPLTRQETEMVAETITALNL